MEITAGGGGDRRPVLVARAGENPQIREMFARHLDAALRRNDREAA